MNDFMQKASEYLYRIRNLKKNINRKKDELEALLVSSTGVKAITYDKDRVQSSPDGSFLEMAVDDIIELEKQIEEDSQKLDEYMGAAYSIVKNLEKPEHRILIELYFLGCVTMRTAADKLHISERNAYYIQDEALEEFGKFLH